jgi:RHS repeat-associated protein
MSLRTPRAGTVTLTTYDDLAGISHEKTVLTGVGQHGAPLEASLNHRIEHDVQGRLIASTDGLGNVRRWGYDSRSSVRYTVDPNGVQIDFHLAADGLPDDVIESVGTPEESSTHYSRDQMRRLVSIEGQRGPVVDIVRDSLGRPSHVRSGSESVTITYNPGGRVATVSDKSESLTTLTYTPLGAVKTISVAAPRAGALSARQGMTAQLTYEYDGEDRLVMADDGANPVARRYDSRGLLLSETVAGVSSHWSYDLAGRVTSYQFPNGRRLTYERAADGRLQRVLDGLPGPAGAIELLRVWSLGYENFVDEQWRGTLDRHRSMDQAGRLLAIDETSSADGRSVFAVRQVADGRGHPIVRRIEIGTIAETLFAGTDSHGRIVGARFDGAAPIDVSTLTGAAATASQVDLDAVIAAVAAAIPAAAETEVITLEPDGARRRFTRDLAGGMVEDRRYDVDVLGRSVEVGSNQSDDVEGLPWRERGVDVKYDAFRRLARVERNGLLAASVDYDALGRIVGVSTQSASTTFIHAGEALVETRETGQVVSQQACLPSGSLIETGLPTSPVRVMLDGQGSRVGLADSGGAVIATALWDPFGELRFSTGKWPSAGPMFQGLFSVAGIDLLLSPARSYDPRTGSFREADPLGFPEGANRALYAGGNPLAFADRRGLMAEPADQSGHDADPWEATKHAWGAAKPILEAFAEYDSVIRELYKKNNLAARNAAIEFIEAIDPVADVSEAVAVARSVSDLRNLNRIASQDQLTLFGRLVSKLAEGKRDWTFISERYGLDVARSTEQRFAAAWEVADAAGRSSSIMSRVEFASKFLSVVSSFAGGWELGTGISQIGFEHKTGEGLLSMAEGATSLGMTIGVPLAMRATPTSPALITPIAGIGEAVAATGVGALAALSLYFAFESGRAAIHGEATPVEVADKFWGHGMQFSDIYQWQRRSTGARTTFAVLTLGGSEVWYWLNRSV